MNRIYGCFFHILLIWMEHVNVICIVCLYEWNQGCGYGRIITNKFCSSWLMYSVACIWHLVRAGRMVVAISFVSSSIIHRNMKLFQHWIKWKGLICWFLYLFIDKEISRKTIISHLNNSININKMNNHLSPQQFH